MDLESPYIQGTNEEGDLKCNPQLSNQPSKSFKERTNGIRQLLERVASSVTTDATRDASLDDCQKQLAELTTSFQIIANTLPAYDKREHIDTLKGLSNKLQHLRKASAPKKKFAFAPKSRAPNTQTQILEPSPGRQDRSTAVSTPEQNIVEGNATQTKGVLAGFTIESLRNSYYVPHVNRMDAVSLSMVDIKTSVMNLSAALKASKSLSNLMVSDVTSSLLICGEIQGPSHITGLNKSTMVLSSRQVRIHDSANSVFYLRCASRPVIENCTGLKFAPLPSNFDTANPEQQNLWNKVNDFKWLRAGQSPNWTLLQAGDPREIPEDILLKLVDKDLQAQDILQAANIPLPIE